MLAAHVNSAPTETTGSLGAPLSNTMLFQYTVLRADSVFEQFGPTKATIQLQVDIEARMLSFVSPDENMESYLCAAVTARPQSRLGMQLKIQTDTTTLTKKINFLSTEERANFIDALEQGKIIQRNKIEPQLSEVATPQKFHWPAVDVPFPLLPGEAVLEHVQRVANLVVMSQSDRTVQGVLKITTFRITFSPYDSSWKFGSFEVPLSALDVITRDGLMLLITCKDLRTIRLAMHDAYTKKKGYDQLPSTPDYRWLNALIQRMRPPNMMGAVFAFDYYAEKKACMMSKPGNYEDGWLLYSPVAEYQRLGFLRGSDAYNSNHGMDPNVISWRLLKNSKFRFSPTYPHLMVVPSLMNETQLVESAKFRAHARLPVAVWRHPVNKCVLARSSQPNYGLIGNRCEADRQLLKAFRDAALTSSNTKEPPALHIVDARDFMESAGNKLKGKGIEKSQHYDNAHVESVGVANMHKMRESFNALKSLILGDHKNFYSRLEGTKWLKHIIDILNGARRVVEILHEDGAAVLVHCSDGWNRTPQLVSLAQLMLDPYYRTIRGFAVLLEKEWCSFGHKFADRIGVGKDAEDQPNERSPVMLHFLDCVWQLLRQFPTAFEFTEKLLLHVWDALLSGLYGTFLYNTERERILEKVWERTESAWTPVLADIEAFRNPSFAATKRVLYARTDEASVVLWEALVFRWDVGRRVNWWDSMDGDYESEEGEASVGDELSECSSLSAHGGDAGVSSDAKASNAPADDNQEGDSQVPGADERARERNQARNILSALTLAPDKTRIKYLEQLLEESFARELALESELGTVQRAT